MKPCPAVVLAVMLLGPAAAGASGAVPASADAASPLRLAAAVEAALAAHPQLAAAAARHTAAEARLRQARAAWLPRLDLRGALTRSDNPVFVFGSLLEQGRFAERHFDPRFLNDPPPLSNDRLAVDLRYALFEPAGRGNAVRQAAHAVTAADLADEELRQRVRAETVADFYAVLVAQQRVAVAADAVGAAEADAAVIRARVEQGMVVDSDLLAAEVQIASLRQRSIAAEGELALTRAALATLLGRPFDDPPALDGELPASAPALGTVEAAVARALADRADVRLARESAESAALRVAAVRGGRLPRADALASYGSSRGNGDGTLGLVVAVPLFDPAQGARVAEASAALAEARAGEAAARDRVTLEVVAAWQAVRAARARRDAAARSVESAEAVVRIVRDRYEQGLTTVTELLRAQTALLEARLESLASRSAELIGSAELLRSMGGLDDVAALD